MFREVLGELMGARGWSPLRLAAALEERGQPVTSVTVGNWLAGRCEPRLSTLKAVADEFEVSLDVLSGRAAANEESVR